MTLAQSLLSGSRLALARLLTLVENDQAEGREALGALFAHTGQAHLIGVTGAPGTGKSSLVNQIARALRHPPGGQPSQRVAIVAVDPSSPFTGGAILGDRIRMRDLAGDPGVFIRSMASRGSLGGLSAATAGVVQVFDAAGFDVVLIETVGAGQSEVDIVRLAHTTLVVDAPGLGDDIQAIKAGILEIADILVINKADQPGVDSTERALKAMLEMAHPVAHTSMVHHGKLLSEPLPPAQPAPTENFWIPPVLRTVAPEALGIAELMQAIHSHRQHLLKSGEWQRRDRERLQFELNALITETLWQRWEAGLSDAAYERAITDLAGRRISPHQAVSRLVTEN